LCVWERPEVAAVSTWLAALGELNGRHTLEVLKPGSRPTLGSLPKAPERALIADDLAMLGELLCDLVGCPDYGLRVARVRSAMCPGWHIDRVTLRLICTYGGVGTEWLTDQSVDRRLLRNFRAGPDDLTSAETADVVLLKGAAWPGNESYGAIHRSPELVSSAGIRTVVTLDPLWRD